MNLSDDCNRSGTCTTFARVWLGVEVHDFCRSKIGALHDCCLVLVGVSVHDLRLSLALVARLIRGDLGNARPLLPGLGIHTSLILSCCSSEVLSSVVLLRCCFGELEYHTELSCRSSLINSWLVQCNQLRSPLKFVVVDHLCLHSL